LPRAYCCLACFASSRTQLCETVLFRSKRLLWRTGQTAFETGYQSGIWLGQCGQALEGRVETLCEGLSRGLHIAIRTRQSFVRNLKCLGQRIGNSDYTIASWTVSSPYSNQPRYVQNESHQSQDHDHAYQNPLNDIKPTMTRFRSLCRCL
jgi:hypothetical protein